LADRQRQTQTVIVLRTAVDMI